MLNDRSELYKNYIEQFLRDWYQQFRDEPQALLFEAMEYSLQAGGKRLRPILTFEFCRLCGGDWKDAAPLAAAVEMVHTYSLIHDDLPCMDDDDYRRGRLCNHKVYGEAMAVLAGDALLTDAFSVATTAQIDSGAKVEAMAVLAGCAGSLGMVGGQVLDIKAEERECTEDEILAVQSRKTGALIRAACAVGAIAGGANEEQYDAACLFAASLGLAFQIRDDMLDVIGSEEEVGKTLGSDEQKNTFVRLYGLDRCEELVRKYTDIALEAISIFEDNRYLSNLALALTSRNN